MSQVFMYIFPGMMIMFIFFIGQTSFNDLYVEQENKTLARMLSSSVSLNQIMIAKLGRCFLICLIAELLLIIITYFFLNLNWGNPLIWFSVLVCLNLAMTGVLSVLYGFTRSKNEAHAICNIFILFSAMLGGGFMPYDELPPILQAVGKYTVNYWGLQGLHVSIYDESITDVLLPIVILVAVGLIGCFVGFLMIRKRIESGVVS